MGYNIKLSCPSSVYVFITYAYLFVNIFNKSHLLVLSVDGCMNNIQFP